MSQRVQNMVPEDQPVRDRLISSFDRNYLVEASAGSGKTTVLVERLVQMLAQGVAKVNEIAALTFTRKAAGEMRSRFFIRLEASCQAAEDSRIKKRLTQALEQIHQCYIGTIHGFCARLLREYSAEAGLPAGFTELDEDADSDIQEELWLTWENQLLNGNDHILLELQATGLAPLDLKECLFLFEKYSDIPIWPAAETQPPDIRNIRTQLESYYQHMASLAPNLPADAADKLMQKYRRLPRLVVNVNWNEAAQVMKHLEEFTPINSGASLTKRRWPGGVKQCDQEWDRWNLFCEQVITPLLHQWRTYRYPIVIRFLQQSERYFREERRRLGLINFHELLLRTVELVRLHPQVRKQIAQQWKRLLVDEFQDTDPLQAELIFLLTAQRNVSNWLKAMPRPGSLLLVGDPKQSIYRFRRADLQVYDQVKTRLLAAGGEAVELTSNFRSQPALVEWFNSTFETVFSQAQRGTQANYSLMLPGFQSQHPLSQCLRYLEISEESAGTRTEDVAQAEAEAICRFIQEACAGSLHLDRSESELKRGLTSQAVPDDFMILSMARERLQVYGDILGQWKIPHQVTGGSQLNHFSGLRLLYLLLKSVSDPDDSASLVGLLRSELCGISDAQLYAFHQSGVQFRWSVTPDPQLKQTALIQPVFQILQEMSQHLSIMPVSAALERAVLKLGFPLWARLISPEAGTGCLAKALICIREENREEQTVQGVLRSLERLMERKPRRDGMFIPSQAGVGVRIMNLHKAKGLEARVVILADSQGGYSKEREPELHVSREQAEPAGYLHVMKTVGPYFKTSLAYPSDWQLLASEEQTRIAAEKQRLLYVAATRAKNLLVVCYRTSASNGSANQRNPWQELIPFLGGASRIEPDESRQPPETTPGQEQFDQSKQPAPSFDTAWLACLTPQQSVRKKPESFCGPDSLSWARMWQSSMS